MDEEEEEEVEVWKMEEEWEEKEEEEEARREAKALRRTGEEARSFWVLVVVVAEVGEPTRGGRDAKRVVCGVFMGVEGQGGVSCGEGREGGEWACKRLRRARSVLLLLLPLPVVVVPFLSILRPVYVVCC